MSESSAESSSTERDEGGSKPVTSVRSMSADIQETAEGYIRHGLAVCRIPFGEKLPTARRWTTRSAKASEFTHGDNIGLICGWLSNGKKDDHFLVCVDLDTQAAIEKADQFLPPTGAIEGRPGKPRSHWWYFVTDVPDWAVSEATQAAAGAIAVGESPGPFKKGFNHAETGERVIDFQGTGGQAVVPPSYHVGSGERRRWEEGNSIEKIAAVPFTNLWDAVSDLGKACGAKMPSTKRPVTTTKPETVSEHGEVAAAEDTPELAAPSGYVQGMYTAQGVPMEERERRCERYLQSVDLARSKKGGHNVTFRVAKLICNDFAVTDREAAMRLIRGYNERLKEVKDGWSEGDLAHKIDGALKEGNAPDSVPDPKFPFGCKLSGHTNRVPDAPQWGDPSKLADAFVQRQPLLYFSGRYFVYNGRNYDEVDANTLKAQVWSFIEAEARRHDPEFPPKISRALRDGVVAAIEARGVERLNGRTKEVVFNAWLPGKGRAGDTLVVRNGLLDVESGTLSPHTPDFLGLYCLPYEYDPAATCPTWEKAVDRICGGNRDVKRLVRQWFGYCLTSSTDQQKFMVLVGEGANGKSTLVGGLLAVIGQANASHVALEKFSGAFDLGYSLGKLVNVPDDMSEIDKASEGVLKSYTSGGAMDFNQKNRPILSARPTAKLMFSTNTVPRFTDRSSGLWRRLLLVPLNVVIAEEERVKGMDKPTYWDSIGETAGMLNWALTGLKSLKDAKGFSVPASVADAVAEHQIESNPTRIFLQEHLQVTKGATYGPPIASHDSYIRYHAWMKDMGHAPLGHIQFSKELRRVYPHVTRVTQRIGGRPHKVIQGIEWTPHHAAWLIETGRMTDTESNPKPGLVTKPQAGVVTSQLQQQVNDQPK